MYCSVDVMESPYKGTLSLLDTLCKDKKKSSSRSGLPLLELLVIDIQKIGNCHGS